MLRLLRYRRLLHLLCLLRLLSCRQPGPHMVARQVCLVQEAELLGMCVGQIPQQLGLAMLLQPRLQLGRPCPGHLEAPGRRRGLQGGGRVPIALLEAQQWLSGWPTLVLCKNTLTQNLHSKWQRSRQQVHTCARSHPWCPSACSKAWRSCRDNAAAPKSAAAFRQHRCAAAFGQC